MKKIYIFMLMLFALHTTHAQNTCATAVPITAIPFTSGTLTTCGAGDDYAAGSYFNSLYGAGEDYVFSINITNAPVTYSMALGGSATYKIASVHSACPPTSGNAIGGVTTGSASAGAAQVSFATNGTYYIIVDTWPSPPCGEFTLSLSVPPPPPANDVCSGAINLPVGTTCSYQTFTTSGATDNNETGDCTDGTEAAVWFKFTATQTNATITVDGAVGFDPVLGVLSGCGSTTAPTGGACIDDTGNDGVETRTLSGLTIGQTYYIQVYDFQGDALATSSFDICVVSLSCPTATSLVVGSITTNSASVTWTGTGNFILEYGLTGFTPGTGATAGVGGTLISPATSPQALSGLSAATGYSVYVRLDCTGSGSGYSPNATTTFTTLPPPPANDDCSGATVIPCDGSVSGSTTGATDDVLPGITCGSTTATTGNNRGVWFTVTPLNSGPMTISTCTGTTWDTYLRVYTGACGAFTECVGFDDFGCSESTYDLSSLTFTAVAGTTYYVLLGGYGATNFGAYTISASCPALPPANDNCAAAITINTVAVPSTNAGATESLPVGVCGGDATITGDVWYTFTAVSSGAATVNVLNVVGFDPVVEVYSGTCAALTNIACADAGGEGGSEIAALSALVAGQIYFVRVYNFESATGTFDISVTGAALPIAIEYFKGSKQNGGHLLDWKVTCYSSPSVNMQLERSADGRSFASINSQTETATRCLQPFSFTDASPLAGINYYRLKSVDVDGKISYSKIVALLNKDKGFEIVSLVPNPVKEEATLSVTSATKSIIEIVVTDLSGKQLSKQRVSLIAGNNLLPLNVRNLPAGSYQVTGITADGVNRTLRFVKQ